MTFIAEWLLDNTETHKKERKERKKAMLEGNQFQKKETQDDGNI